MKTRLVEVMVRKKREPGGDYAVCAVSMPASECSSELNALRRHLRDIPKFDYGERAEALACIAHVRARQLALATQAAAVEHAKDVRDTIRMRRRHNKQGPRSTQ